MALTPNFSSAESIASNNLVTFTDTSVGSDGNIDGRRIYCLLADGTYLVPSGTTTDYIEWNYADSSITVDLLTQSTVSEVTVKWMDGTSVLYTKTILTEWNLYDYLFALELLQSQTATPNIIQDNSYYSNYFMFLTNLWNSENAVTYGDDLYSAASALSKNQYLIDNQNKFF